MNVEYLKNENCLTVKPEGRMDTNTSPILNEQTKEKLEGITELILDLEKVAYVSSGGLRVILEWLQIMEDRGGQFKMRNVNDFIKKVLDLTGLLNDLTIE